MMISNRRSLILTVCLLATLAFLAVGSAHWMYRQRATATTASSDLDSCRELERLILAMRQHTTLVSTQTMEGQELGRRIDDAAKLARLNLETLQGVFPQTAGRVGNHPFLEKPTTLTFRKVEAQTLAAFLFHLTHSSGLVLRQLHLRAPHGNAASTLWDADATVSCLIYAPLDNSRGN